jgi:hypothetical protein
MLAPFFFSEEVKGAEGEKCRLVWWDSFPFHGSFKILVSSPLHFFSF